MEVVKCPVTNCTSDDVYVHYETDEGVIYFKCATCGALFS